MALPRHSRLLVLTLLAGGAAACAGPTSDFPYNGPALGGGGGGGGTGTGPALNGGTPDTGTTGVTAGEGSTTGGTTTGGTPTGGLTAGAASDAGLGFSDAASDGSACPSPSCKADADGGADAACDAGSEDASLHTTPSDAAPDPCEGAEGGTSADG